jgi:hypothetical protein
LLKLCRGGVTIKRRGDDFEMKILNILNANSTRFIEISKEEKKDYNKYCF